MQECRHWTPCGRQRRTSSCASFLKQARLWTKHSLKCFVRSGPQAVCRRLSCTVKDINHWGHSQLFIRWALMFRFRSVSCPNRWRQNSPALRVRLEARSRSIVRTAQSKETCLPAYRRRALRAAPRAPCRVAAMRLRSLTSPADGMPPACALRLPSSCLQLWWDWLADPFILAHRSRRQGLRALWALAAVRPSSNL